MPPTSELAARVHAANKNWWIHIDTGAPLIRNVGELLMLVVSELSEAMEGHRKRRMDDKLPARPMIEVEIADAYIRVLDILGGLRLNTTPQVAVLRWSPNVGECLLMLTAVIHQAYVYQNKPAELARMLNRLLSELESFTNMHDLDLPGAFEEKMLYNASRLDHTLEHRRAEGGKKY